MGGAWSGVQQIWGCQGADLGGWGKNWGFWVGLGWGLGEIWVGLGYIWGVLGALVGFKGGFWVSWSFWG